MDSALFVHRLHFAFTITFHYLFPQLTIGLSLLIVILKTMAIRTPDPHYDDAALFLTRIFGINFGVGVVTGIPMEFQFGTNWAIFSRSAGGVIGQTLAMEGVFSFFLESTFLGLLVYGEKRMSRAMHWFAAFAVFAGSWLSGYFIIVTDAWMQHPVGYTLADGRFQIASFAEMLLNPWAAWQYAHNMTASVVTASFVVASIGSFYLLMGAYRRFGETFVRLGVICGCAASIIMIFPTGDGQGKMIALHQPVTLSAMEGLFDTAQGAPLALIGQPDVEKLRLDNPVVVPNMLSFLTYQRWHAEVKGLREYPRDRWPDNIPLLYFSYHIMVGLGTIFVAAMGASALMLWRGVLFTRRYMLWMLMLLLPFPYIATTAGWITAEVGRQPWLVYGLMRTAAGASPQVSAGNAWFTLLGFMGLYMVLGLLFLFLVQREIEHGPSASGAH